MTDGMRTLTTVIHLDHGLLERVDILKKRKLFRKIKAGFSLSVFLFFNLCVLAIFCFFLFKLFLHNLDKDNNTAVQLQPAIIYMMTSLPVIVLISHTVCKLHRNLENYTFDKKMKKRNEKEKEMKANHNFVKLYSMRHFSYYFFCSIYLL